MTIDKDKEKKLLAALADPEKPQKLGAVITTEIRQNLEKNRLMRACRVYPAIEPMTEFQRETLSVPVSIRWTVMDGQLHVEGRCCGDGDIMGRRCARCRGRVHQQAIYGGIAWCCEGCPEDAHYWETGPMPPTDKLGFVESDRLRVQRELAERSTIDAQQAYAMFADGPYIPGVHEGTLALQRVDVSMGCRISDRCMICEQPQCAHLGTAPFLAFAPYRPMTTQEKIDCYASGQGLPYPLHDECLWRGQDYLSGFSYACRACMSEHDPGDEDPRRRSHGD